MAWNRAGDGDNDAAAGPESITVASVRIDRLVEALSLVAAGEHSAALTVLPAAAEGDGFTLLESCIHVLVVELERSHRANARYLAELEESGRQLAERLTLIEQQRVALTDLSTPIIEVWAGVLALPIVGAVDASRAQLMSEQLLQRVTELRAREVILDLTGMEADDAVTIENLVRMARGVELLGARCMVTGIHPKLANTLADLRLDLRGVRSLRTLKDGLVEVLRAPSPRGATG